MAVKFSDVDFVSILLYPYTYPCLLFLIVIKKLEETSREFLNHLRMNTTCNSGSGSTTNDPKVDVMLVLLEPGMALGPSRFKHDC